MGCRGSSRLWLSSIGGREVMIHPLLARRREGISLSIGSAASWGMGDEHGHVIQMRLLRQMRYSLQTLELMSVMVQGVMQHARCRVVLGMQQPRCRMVQGVQQPCCQMVLGPVQQPRCQMVLGVQQPCRLEARHPLDPHLGETLPLLHNE